MGNLDPAVIQSSKSITLYNCGLTVIENMVFLVLKKWDMTVLFGSSRTVLLSSVMEYIIISPISQVQ